MKTTAPELNAFTTELLPGGMRFTLPYRSSRKHRGIGIGSLCMGLVLTCFMLLWMYQPMTTGFGLIQKGQAFGLLLVGFGLLGLGGLVPGLILLLFGLSILTNRSRCTIEARDERLYANEDILLVTWRRKREIHAITELLIEPAPLSPPNPDSMPPYPENVLVGDWGIVIRGDHIKDLRIAPGYPKELLHQLAEALADHLSDKISVRPFDGRSPNPESTLRQSGRPAVLIANAEDFDENQPPPVQPMDSDATLERRPDGITIHFPPTGIWKGSKGLLFFSVVWNGFLAVMLIILIYSAIGSPPPQGAVPWFVFLFFIPFLAIGVYMTLKAVTMGRSLVSIGTTGSTMIMMRKTPFRDTVKRWRAEDLEEIRVGPSGMEINDEAVMELQIRPRLGKKLGLLSQRDEYELHWVAAELNQALGLGRGNGNGLTAEPGGREEF